jgi:hypothetical protein
LWSYFTDHLSTHLSIFQSSPHFTSQTRSSLLTPLSPANSSVPPAAISRLSTPEVEVEVTLRVMVGQSVCLGVGHPFGAHDQILLFLFICRKIVFLFVSGRPLWLEDGSVICSAICQWSESRKTHNHTLLSHLRLLGSLSVASYDSQGLRWKYPYPPQHAELSTPDSARILLNSCEILAWTRRKQFSQQHHYCCVTWPSRKLLQTALLCTFASRGPTGNAFPLLSMGGCLETDVYRMARDSGSWLNDVIACFPVVCSSGSLLVSHFVSSANIKQYY